MKRKPFQAKLSPEGLQAWCFPLHGGRSTITWELLKKPFRRSLPTSPLIRQVTEGNSDLLVLNLRQIDMGEGISYCGSKPFRTLMVDIVALVESRTCATETVQGTLESLLLVVLQLSRKALLMKPPYENQNKQTVNVNITYELKPGINGHGLS